ncbi:UDP-N-acetylmuramoylalanyl-D-glutamyl-2, 6-diaminopimelate--D-alanyl-D-alanine ligase [Chitinispirillum alkaliphilum]|nr:UDP-N-acetylmuramoylalanyl-D-glutamyl-2, 6-diaminopimelate--D-alanyl-D-alanine ligase [Chitinispirillum alkaliphilum]
MSSKSNTSLTLGTLVDWGRGYSEMSDSMCSKKVGTVWNDSRKVTRGDVFAAFRTECNDGHKFVKAAFDNGAVAAIVDKKGVKDVAETLRNKCIVVNDTLKGVQRMAARYRKEMGLLVIGITGSNGKTTTRAFISSVLRNVIKVGETYTNWNNHIGVPLSLLRFEGDEWAGVIEMGANHENEIRPLSKLVKPDIAVISNIGYAHVGLFGSLEKTTKAKFEISEGLSRDGFMLLNGDDARLVKGAAERGLKSVFYGTSPRCDIRVRDVNVCPETGITFTVDGQEYLLRMPGRHFIYCVLPAIYIAKRCRVPDEVIRDAIADLEPVSLRGMVKEKNDVRFIVDCYNANPGSMDSAIAYMRDITESTGNRVAVVGDMLELGVYSKRLHKRLGSRLAKADLKIIVAVGEFAEDVIEGARKEGFPVKRIFGAKNADGALEVLKNSLKGGETILLKGSRSIGLEKVYEGY